MFLLTWPYKIASIKSQVSNLGTPTDTQLQNPSTQIKKITQKPNKKYLKNPQGLKTLAVSGFHIIRRKICNFSINDCSSSFTFWTAFLCVVHVLVCPSIEIKFKTWIELENFTFPYHYNVSISSKKFLQNLDELFNLVKSTIVKTSISHQKIHFWPIWFLGLWLWETFFVWFLRCLRFFWKGK